MKKIISFVGLFAVLGVGIGDAHGVAMSAQVRRLLQEKQEKIEQLEKCEGKKQGWMIAGISTIGLTAVGVGVNIAQASKSNRLSSEIEMEKSTLERHQNDLNRINSQISELQAKKAEENKCCDMKRRCCECEKLRNGDCPGGDDDDGNLTTYSDYVLSCKMTMFTFRTGQVRDDLVDALNKACYEVTKQYTERTETDGFVKYECKDYREKANCDKQQKRIDVDTGVEPVTPVTPVKPGQNCRTSHGKKPTTDCPCDGDKGLLDFGRGKCECKPGEEWNGQKCVGKKDEKKDDKKPAGQCIKTYGEYLGVGCVCDSGKGLVPVLDDMSDKRYCGCGMSDTWDGSKCVKGVTNDRVLGQPCRKSDLPTDATEGIYWEKPGKYKCKYNDELVSCSCRVDKCKGDLVADENHEKCVKKNLVTDCSEGYVRIGGNGECVKRDYLFTDQCKCAKDPSKKCKLDTDHGGDLVCQLAKGIGKKCKCEDCPNGEIIDTNTGKCVEPGKQNVGWLGPNGGLGFDPKP